MAAITTTETATVPVFLLLQDIQNSLMTPKPPVTPTPLVSMAPYPIPTQLPPPPTAPTTHEQAQREPSIPTQDPSKLATSSSTTDLVQTHQSPTRPPPPAVPPKQHGQPSRRPKLTLNTTCPPPLPPPPRPPPPPSLPLLHNPDEEACLKTDTPTYQNTLLNAGMKGRNAVQSGGSVPELILPSQSVPAGEEGDAKEDPEIAGVGATIAGPEELPSLGLLQIPPPYSNTQTQMQAQQGTDTTRVRFRSPLEEVIERDPNNLPLMNHGHEIFSSDSKDDGNGPDSRPGTGYIIPRKIPARQGVAAADPDATTKSTGATASASIGASGGATAAGSAGTERTKPKSVGLRRKPVPNSRLGLGVDAKARPLGVGVGLGRRRSLRSLRENQVARERLNPAGRERDRDGESQVQGQGQGGRRRKGQVKRVDGWVVVGA